MTTINRTLLQLCAAIFAASLSTGSSSGEIERFIPRQGGTTEIWRITNRPEQRDWANYHNTEAWSPDGRYICYESFTDPNEVNIYDLVEAKEIKVDNGSQPRWANNNNWLFYLRRSTDGKGTDVIWYNVDAGKKTRIGTGVDGIGETDSDDRWLFGKNRKGIVRVPIREDARVEDISAGGALGSFMIPNPAHPLVMFRGDSRDANGNDLPYAPTRVWSDLEGNNVVNASPMIQRCHQAWSGDGTYHLHGNSQVRGRRWDEPFPSNLHYLAAIDVHDICSGGRSGRRVIGSGNVWPMYIADLRSGDGWIFLWGGLSRIHDSKFFSYSNGSGLHDNDAKGSPDGTKVVFTSTYDLRDGPVTEITADVPDPNADSIPVVSTDGFPESGMLSVQNEIIGYKHKTPTSFEGLTRQMLDAMPLTGSMLEDLTPERRELYAKRPDNKIQPDASTYKVLEPYLNRPLYLSKGIIVTSFDARILPASSRKHSLMPSRINRDTFPGDYGSILKWQRHTDVYVAVVRSPDRPVLREIDGQCELIPGENHWEIKGYDLYRDGSKVTKQPLKPASSFIFPGPGIYTAVAVEWSGLASAPSFPLTIRTEATVFIRKDKPGDFQWTTERWLENGKPVSVGKGKLSEEAVREIFHLIDGVIHREWYTWGQITMRHDLNVEGKAIRRLYYRDGILVRREYHSREGLHISTELFAPDGYITESIRYKYEDGNKKEIGHWWFDKGTPVKLIGSEGHTLVSLPGIYLKEGENWVWRPMP